MQALVLLFRVMKPIALLEVDRPFAAVLIVKSTFPHAVTHSSSNGNNEKRVVDLWREASSGISSAGGKLVWAGSKLHSTGASLSPL
jgi:hypothetical protein